MPFFESFPGNYLAQAVFYSLVTISVVETVLTIWRVQEPLIQIKFRFLALLLPALCPPIYNMLYPSRNAEYFRGQIALIDINQWLALELGNDVAVWHLFSAILVVTTTAFLVREVTPLIRHYAVKRPSLPRIRQGQFPKLDKVLADLLQLGLSPAPALLLSPENAAVAYSSDHEALVLSAAMINLLDEDELRIVIAHETAHRSRRIIQINRILLALRFWLFYNPVALLIFHRIINDIEKLCDDVAVRFSGKKLSLASGLLKISRHQATTASTAGKHPLRSRIASLESAAHRNLTGERVRRIMQSGNRIIYFPDFRVVFTGILLALLLFFVV